MKNSIDSMGVVLTPQQDRQLREVADSYESIFLNQLIQSMRKTVQYDGVVPQSHAEKVYQSMLDDEYSKSMAKSGSIGISEMVYDYMKGTMKGY